MLFWLHNSLDAASLSRFGAVVGLRHALAHV